MKQKEIVLVNKGMNRDLSVSKLGGSSAFENHNIRITASDKDTLLSVTNERGNKQVSLGGILEGELVGWNVLNNHIILFTHEDLSSDSGSGDAVELSSLALRSGSSVTFYGTNYEGENNKLSFHLHMVQSGSPVNVKNIKVWYLPISVFEDETSKPWEEGLTIRAVFLGSSQQASKVFEVSMSDIDGTLYEDTYCFAIEYAIGNIGHSEQLDVSDEEDTSDSGGGSGASYSVNLLAEWVNDIEIQYTLSIVNSGSSQIQFTDLTLDLKVTDTEYERPEEGESINPSGTQLGTISVLGGQTRYINGSLGLFSPRNYSKVYWINAYASGFASAFQQIEENPHEGSESGGGSGSGSGSGGGGEETVPVESITLTPSGSIEIEVGESIEISAQVVPADATVQNVVFGTEFDNIAYVSSRSGNTFTVIGRYPGKALFVATPDDDYSDVSASKYVTVVPAGGESIDAYVWDMSVMPPTATLDIGDTQQFTATGYYTDGDIYEPHTEDITESEHLTWISTNTDVATISAAGLVTAVGSGNCVIRASYNDGEHMAVVSPDRYVIVREAKPDDDDDYTPSENGIDRIYCIEYNAGETPEFNMLYGGPLFEGNLNFDLEHPIQSIVYHETDDIQKIYWVDGKNVLRFMNFMEKPDTVTGKFPWTGDNTYFDSNRATQFDVNVGIEKDGSGNNRPNGVVQYILTYFNKHGQETGVVWMSDLVYLAPEGRGGTADGTNSNKVTLTFSNLDTSFSHLRVYSVFRSSRDGQVVAYLVSEQLTSSDAVVVVDDGGHLVMQDTMRLLYLGSQPVKAGTLTHKDQTMFLGDLQSIGREDYSAIEELLAEYRDENGISSIVSFVYTNNANDGTYENAYAADIPYVEDSGNYPYNNQLLYSSSNILTFKGGEKYRFAIKFRLGDGTETDAFWIGDAINDKYPIIDVNNAVIKRVVAKCVLPVALVADLHNNHPRLKTAQLMIAEATDSDRSVKAQGIVNPTMFNVWERYNNRNYAIPSWIARPRGSEYANLHFMPVHNATKSTGEIQCNYWESEGDKAPYYSYTTVDNTVVYTEEFEGSIDADCVMVIYGIKYVRRELPWFALIGVPAGLGLPFWVHKYDIEVTIVTGKAWGSDTSEMLNYEFPSDPFADWDPYLSNTGDDSKKGWYYMLETVPGKTTRRYRLEKYTLPISSSFSWYSTKAKARERAFNDLQRDMVNAGLGGYVIKTQSTFNNWCDDVDDWFGSSNSSNAATYAAGTRYYFSTAWSGDKVTSLANALNHNGAQSKIDRWIRGESNQVDESGAKTPALYKKHLMFVDENVVTLDSPELYYNSVNFDNAGYKFRIVGIARETSVISDYSVNVKGSVVPGETVDVENFSGNISGRANISGIISWPLWKDYGLDLTQEKSEAETANGQIIYEDRTSSDYTQVIPGRIVRYWLHMWHHSGGISGYVDAETGEMAILDKKTFANLRFSYGTTYFNTPYVFTGTSMRVADGLNSVTTSLSVAGRTQYYSAKVSLILGMPGKLKYPLSFSSSRPIDTDHIEVADSPAYLYSDAPVLLEYASDRHAVVCLPSVEATNSYTQTILPAFVDTEKATIYSYDGKGVYLPWISDTKKYATSQDTLSVTANDNRAWWPAIETTTENNSTSRTQFVNEDKYFFIGEIYRDFASEETDTRYGGISASAVAHNRFIAAGPQYKISTLGSDCTLIGNQGDTYFQRWDCLKTKPYSNDSVNNVIDITSVMLETHINLDGRTDLQRGIKDLVYMDMGSFGQINPVYSQQNNFSVRRDLDEDFNTDVYRSTITWTLPKSDMAMVDEWSHITLATNLKLDADKGWCQALCRFNNNIIAFQDKAISEILFNSRTQLATQEGVPIEIANSGKVDGKRYVSNKYGCTNKWSIVEGKSALYFVDNINKAFCTFTYSQYGKAAVADSSTSLGFGVWFRSMNNKKPWTPATFNNLVAYYDKVHSDVYLVKKETNSQADDSVLVFNETLGAFTSFYSFGSVPMITNVDDRLVAFRDGMLWLQKEGAYCNFFGSQKPFSVQYRVTPDPFGDKIWTNVEYRADFYRVLDSTDNYNDKFWNETGFINDMTTYQPFETFDTVKFWNEYQTTTNVIPSYEKRFRIWRITIPRAIPDGDNNKYGLDRIRNPWINILFKKENYASGEEQDLMQLHDLTVTYYE